MHNTPLLQSEFNRSVEALGLALVKAVREKDQTLFNGIVSKFEEPAFKQSLNLSGKTVKAIVDTIEAHTDNSKKHHKRTALDWATAHGDQAKMKTLLDLGAKIGEAFKIAHAQGNSSTAEILIGYGARVQQAINTNTDSHAMRTLLNTTRGAQEQVAENNPHNQNYKTALTGMAALLSKEL